MAHRLEDLAWMSGTWCRDDEDSSDDEVWLEPRGGLMLGMHREVPSSGETRFEYLRIEDGDEGLTYSAVLGDERPIRFTLREARNGHVEFQRSFPDFPSVVTYWLDGDSLCARIEGLHRGRNRTMEWRWQRRAHL